jgi:PAS domain S-box-containing protein
MDLPSNITAPLSGNPADAENLIASIGTQTISLLFNQFPEPVAGVGYDGRTLFLNPALKEILNCSSTTHGSLLYTEIFQTEMEENKGCVIEASLKGVGPLSEVAVRLRSARGEWIPLLATVSTFGAEGKNPAGCIAIFRERQDSLCDSRKRISKRGYPKLLEALPLPFFTVGSDMVLTGMNEALEKLTGYTEDEILNRKTCAEALSTPYCNNKDCLLKQAMKDGSSIETRSTITDRDGRKIPVMITSSAMMDQDGRVIGGFETVSDITPIVEAEQKLELLTEITHEGILLVDEKQRIIFANSKMEEILDQPKEQLLGTEVSKILPFQHQKMLADLIRKADHEHAKQLRFCTTIQPAKNSHKTSQAFETCISVSHVGKSVITCMHFFDLTERIEIERQIRHTNSFLRNIIRSSADGIIVVDTEGKVLIFNEGAARILGFKAEEMIGKPGALRQLCSLETARENMRRMRSSEFGPPGKLISTRLSFYSKSGEVVPVNFSAAIIREGERELGSVGIFTDLREHLRIRRELEEAKIQLLQAEKIASLGRLSAGVAHEINNPLAGILIYADMLMKDIGDNPQWRQDLEEIINQTLRCKEIVMRLLEFSRQSIGRQVSFAMNDIIIRCVELLRHQSLFHDIKIVQDLQPDLPEIIGDPGQLQQVFTNILINAADAMDRKGRIHISSSFDQQSGEVVLEFSDTGPGIESDDIDKVFEPFFTTKPPGEGTGLGLSVAYGIIQQHGGRISADNAPGGGALFTITLPLEPPEISGEMIDEE